MVLEEPNTQHDLAIELLGCGERLSDLNAVRTAPHCGDDNKPQTLSKFRFHRVRRHWKRAAVIRFTLEHDLPASLSRPLHLKTHVSLAPPSSSVLWRDATN